MQHAMRTAMFQAAMQQAQGAAAAAAAAAAAGWPGHRGAAYRGGAHSGTNGRSTPEAPKHSPENVPARKQSLDSEPECDPAQSSYRGVFKTYSPKDGYGFIHCPALKEGFDRDIYIHKAQVPEGASCGCSLSFGLHLNSKGQPQARNVSLLHDAEAEGPCPRSRELLLDFIFEPVAEEISAVPSGSRLANTVRIGSWNILAAAYANCKAFPDVEPSLFSWPRRRPLIAAALQRLDADVVCLQEVDRPVADLGLEDYDHVRAQRPDSRADGCIIAWKKERFEAVRKEVISFDDYLPTGLDEEGTNAVRFRRGNCAVIVELKPLKKGELPFVVSTAHLCWEAECEDVRQLQIMVLLQALEPHSKRAGHRSVLCGDLNAMPGCASHGLITSLMPSVYSDLEAAGIVTNSNASAGAPVIAGVDGVVEAAAPEGVGFAGMLDYLCLDSRAAIACSRLRLPSRAELRAKLGQGDASGPLPTLLCQAWPSDHFPVAAEVGFTMNWQ
jgi:endonuclease/exonuclease/phosphatase family metal-dependent hydrolase/cold shock CspA family protein